MFNLEKHQSILIRILKDIYTDVQIGPALGFKGGTAVYLFYDLPRFSVDLDFNLLEKEKKDLVFKRIKEILKQYGQLKEAREKRFTLFFLLSYGSEQRKIKVEISKRRFPDSYELRNYLGLSMLVMKKEDMLAHKLVTLLERKMIANRDLFDLWYFLQSGWPVNQDLIKLRTQQDLAAYLAKCIRAVEKVNEKYLLSGLGEILDQERKDWVKKNLKKELLFYLKYYRRQSLGH